MDESHVTMPQVRAMYRWDRARKDTLVEYGSGCLAFDNPALKFEEFREWILSDRVCLRHALGV